MDDMIDKMRDQIDKLDLSPGMRDVLLILVALAVVGLLQRVIRGILIRLIRRVAKEETEEWDAIISDVIGSPLNYLLLALALQMVAAIAEVGGIIDRFVNNLVPTLIIMAVIVFFYELISRTSRSTYLLRSVTGLRIQPELLPFVRTGIRLALIVSGAVLILQEWGYDVATLAAGLGIGGLAIALAAQETLANLFGFATIVGDRPFVEGDAIKTPDVEGTVENVGLRSTRIRQANQALVSIPNSKLAGSVILNWSTLTKRQLDFTLKLNYGVRSDQLYSLLYYLRETLKANQYVDSESIVVYFTNFGDSALEVLIRCYLLLPDWNDFTREREVINLQIMDLVERMGLEIARPSQTIVIESATASPPLSGQGDIQG